jgi:hypothetical protein
MTKNLVKNKKGDITITIFVIGVLALCILAIFSFSISKQGIENGLGSVSIIEEISTTKEKISFYSESLGFTQEQIKEIFYIKEEILPGDKTIRYITAEKGPISVRYNLPK